MNSQRRQRGFHPPWLRICAITIVLGSCLRPEAVADSHAGEEKAQLCVLCHKEAPDRRFVPLLEQQPADYLAAALKAYKTGERKETSMTTNAASLSEADIGDLSAYFASKAFPARDQGLDPAKIAAGEKLAKDMACATCHGADFHGAPATPRLAGQKIMYLVTQMEAFRDGRRPLPPQMAMVRDRDQIESVASYVASLP
jgi:cytochrome c553